MLLIDFSVYTHCNKMWATDKMWSIGEGNGKPLQHPCLENPINSKKKKGGGMGH